jgi:hypothetical protein
MFEEAIVCRKSRTKATSWEVPYKYKFRTKLFFKLGTFACKVFSMLFLLQAFLQCTLQSLILKERSGKQMKDVVKLAITIAKNINNIVNCY